MTTKVKGRTLAIGSTFLLLTGCCLVRSAADSPVPLLPDLIPGETRPDGALRLTKPPFYVSDQNPAFSPDGTQLVFTRFEQGYNDGPAGLFLLTIENGYTRRLTPFEDQDNVNLPGAVWNETSYRIVFASDREESDDLWSVAPDGSDLARITTHIGPTDYIEPSWSPDGQWIVFEVSQPGSSEDGRVGHVWKSRPDGSDLTQLTDGAIDDRQPNWSPAGDRILYQRRTFPAGQWDIYSIATDGSDAQQVTHTPSSDTDASWSPSGGCIVYSSDYEGLSVANIYIVSATAGIPIRVTNDATYDGAPSWSPDGHWIAFESSIDSAYDGPTSLWRIAVPQDVCDKDTVRLRRSVTEIEGEA